MPRLLQSRLVAGRFANLDVGHQAEDRPAPIGPPPGGRAVEPAVAGLRQSFGHVAHHVGPNGFCAKLTGLNPIPFRGRGKPPGAKPTSSVPPPTSIVVLG